MLSAVADLLGLDIEQLGEMLVSTVTAMRGERLRKNFDVEAAEENRDATAKASEIVIVEACCSCFSRFCCEETYVVRWQRVRMVLPWLTAVLAGYLWTAVCVDRSQGQRIAQARRASLRASQEGGWRYYRSRHLG